MEKYSIEEKMYLSIAALFILFGLAIFGYIKNMIGKCLWQKRKDCENRLSFIKLGEYQLHAQVISTLDNEMQRLSEKPGRLTILSPEIGSSQLLTQQLLDKRYWKFIHCPQDYLIQRILTNDLEGEKLTQKFGNKLQNILIDISFGYKNMQYHNLTHAFDVATCLDQILSRGLREKLQISQTQYAMCLIAAYSHDLGHEGLSNAYYTNSKHKWFTEYQRQSSLEKMHIRQLFAIFSKYQEFLIITPNERKLIASLILSTDNLFHHQKIYELQQLTGQLSNISETKMKDQIILQKKQFILGLSLHFADLNNSTKQLDVFVNWSSRLFHQFEKQAEIQLHNLLPITYVTNISNLEKNCSQFTFMKTMVIPLYQQLRKIDEISFGAYSTNLNKNFEYYRKEKNKGRRLTR